MGFLVPQARKEIRALNAALIQRQRPTVVAREFVGASVDVEGSFSVPARKNLLYALKSLYEEEKVDGVYWITALGGIQSGDGLHLLEEMLTAPGLGATGKRRLIIRNLWQEQAAAGRRWADHPPGPAIDPLDEKSLPSDWFKVVKAGDGYLVRSWQLPPREFLDYFGPPSVIEHPSLLKRLGMTERRATIDTTWRTRLAQHFALEFARPDDHWPVAVTGRQWLEQSVLLPYLNEETLAIRTASVFQSMTARESIAEDLARIPNTKKLGVLFGFGHVRRDLERYRTLVNRETRDPRMRHIADLTRIVAEAREQAAADADHPGRVYASEFVELAHSRERDAQPDRYARRMARLVREEGVDAIYFFTNGYTGGGEYGHFETANHLISAAIREAGVRLYLRVPFEFGVVPMELQRLALASGGGVFFGTADDADWEVAPPTPAWPEPPAE